MKLKTVKTRNQFGVIEAVELVDTDGVIAIAAEIWRQQPNNEKCIELFRWIKELGHKPNDAEFMDWLKGHGIMSIPLEEIQDSN